MQATRPRDLTNARGVHILARSLFREMRQQGYSKAQIIGLSTELLHLVSEDLQKLQVATPPPVAPAGPMAPAGPVASAGAAGR